MVLLHQQSFHLKSKLHGFWVHLQIIQWEMLDKTQSSNPTNWGWKITDGYLVPIPTDMDAASANILQVIKCRFESSSRNQYETNLFSFKKMA